MLFSVVVIHEVINWNNCGNTLPCTKNRTLLIEEAKRALVQNRHSYWFCALPLRSADMRFPGSVRLFFFLFASDSSPAASGSRVANAAYHATVAASK